MRKRSKDIPEDVKAKNIVFRLLKIRPRSEKELRDHLKLKGIRAKIIDQTIEYLAKIDLINDPRFAKAWAASRLKKPFGVYRIRHELRNKGITKETLNDVLTDAIENYDEVDVARDLAQRRFKKYPKVEKFKAKQRVYQYLIRRGFSTHSIKRAMSQL